ncbi:MAG: enoyl-CoA hydratase-related protein [Myxococcota bacterium]
MSAAPAPLVLEDDPRPFVRRLTLNRPKKRNALSNPLRGELFDALHRADADRDVRVVVLRGAGSSFSSGYDLSSDNQKDLPYPSTMGDGFWPRHVVDGAFRIWDLAKPVIAQVHGYCLAGGSELMASCDLAYVAETAQIGYPPVRLMSPPDNQFHPWLAGMRDAMELMLTGDAVDGPEACRMRLANRWFPDEALEDEVLAIAERVAKIPTDLQQLNKRSVHRAMEIMGVRAAIRAGTEIQTLGFHQKSARAYLKKITEDLNEALEERDKAFGDFRGRDRSGDEAE